MAAGHVGNRGVEDLGFRTLRLRRSEPPASRTILCANDRLAFGVIAAVRQCGQEVGHRAKNDLRVAGHDDRPRSQYACPPITTVARNHNEIGRFAIGIILHKLGETEGPNFEKKSNLMLRRSA